jgi:hypothetical protein
MFSPLETANEEPIIPWEGGGLVHSVSKKTHVMISGCRTLRMPKHRTWQQFGIHRVLEEPRIVFVALKWVCFSRYLVKRPTHGDPQNEKSTRVCSAELKRVKLRDLCLWRSRTCAETFLRCAMHPPNLLRSAQQTSCCENRLLTKT